MVIALEQVMKENQGQTLLNTDIIERYALNTVSQKK